MKGRFYVDPPTSGAKDIVARIRSGTAVVLVGGPAGIGKSTELACALVPLRSDHVACLVPLDKLQNVRKLDVGRLCNWLMQGLVYQATELKLELSASSTKTGRC